MSTTPQLLLGFFIYVLNFINHIFKINMSFKRNDKFVPAEQCGVVTQAGEIATVATAALTAGVAVATAPVAILSAAGVSAALLTAGHIIDHKKLDTQDKTPVVDASVAS